MAKKNEPQESDYLLIRAQMRSILDDPECHPRDRIQAGKLLRQIHLDESELVVTDSPFTMESLGFGS